MGKPKVSICIPCYNNVNEVRRLLISIAGQTFRDWEIILTDDSTDKETEELVSRIRQGKEADICLPGYADGTDADTAKTGAAKNGQEDASDRFRYYHNEKPLGHIFNWNRALELARGEYIKIMFSDDWFTGPESLGKMVRLLEEDPEASLAFCGTRQVSEKRTWERAAEKVWLEGLREDYRNLFLGNQVGAPSATLYRACGAAFDERSNWASDMFLYFEILSRNPRFVCTPEPLISIGLHGEQYTGTFTERDIRKYQDRHLMYHKYGLEQNEACRREMLRLTVMYGQGLKTARGCGAGAGEYLRERLRWFWQNAILGYWNGLLHRLMTDAKGRT